MAAAAPLFSDYFAEPGHWDQHAPTTASIVGAVGEASGSNNLETMARMCNIALRSPVAVAFMLAGDTDHIYVGSNPTIFPPDPLEATAYDGNMVVLLGNNLQTATPVVLGANHFVRSIEVHCHTADELVRQHNAGVPVIRTGPHANGAADTSGIHTRPAFCLPPDRASEFVLTNPDGRHTLQGFYNTFINGERVAGGARAVAVQALTDWWRHCCTDRANPNPPRHCVDPITDPLPLHQARLTAWVHRVKEGVRIKLGVGGPGLTTVAFAAGIQDVQAAIRDTSAAHLQFERDRMNRTFTDKYGAAIAQTMYNLTGAADDAHLPTVHTLLAAAPKGRAYAILESCLHERALASAVPLNAGNLPIATTKLTDSVFRSFKPATTGLTFGEGLTPFAMVCEGHSEAIQVMRQLKKAEYVESGTSLTLADAEILTTTDVRFPTTPQAAVEKLAGWSVCIDLFHGVLHPVSGSVRDFMCNVGPGLHSIHQAAGTNATGMDLVLRVLFEAQQEYFQWATACARENNPARRPAPPTFDRIKSAVLTFRADSLSKLPAPWYTLMDPPSTGERTPRERQRPNDRSTRQQENATAVFNSRADRALLRRFRDSGHANITAMMNGHEVQIPKHAGNEVCLTWALKGECSAACRRTNQHVAYSQATNRAIGALLTSCGVPELQE